VLLAFAERDERVPTVTSRANIEEALRRAGNSQVTVRVFPGANHTFHQVEAAGAFRWPRAAPGYVDTLVTWARGKVAAR